MGTGIVQQIFNDHFPDYRLKIHSHSRIDCAAWSIMTCKTPDQGYHINACPNGDFEAIVFNSCKHRACPQCGATDTELWLQRRRAQALDCHYFQVVFTIDHDLHIIWRFNRKLFTRLLMRAAWHSLRELLLDWKYLGGLAGAVAAFQSWDDELNEHCHAHFIVTGGGLNADGRWVSAKPDFLLPGEVLATKFRGKFLDYLRWGFSRYSKSGRAKNEDQVLRVPSGMRLQQCLNLLNRLGRKPWHTNIEPGYGHADGVLKYVGRYLRRGPVSEQRIIGYDGANVTIAYAHREKHPKATFTLPAHSFIKRFLNHVPEKGTHVVRCYGLFHPNCLEKLNIARKLLNQPPLVGALRPIKALELLQQMFKDPGIGRCPICHAELRTVFIRRGGKVLDLRLAA
jgi:hypothetical protein